MVEHFLSTSWAQSPAHKIQSYSSFLAMFGSSYLQAKERSKRPSEVMVSAFHEEKRHVRDKKDHVWDSGTFQRWGLLVLLVS